MYMNAQDFILTEIVVSLLRQIVNRLRVKEHFHPCFLLVGSIILYVTRAPNMPPRGRSGSPQQQSARQQQTAQEKADPERVDQRGDQKSRAGPEHGTAQHAIAKHKNTAFRHSLCGERRLVCIIQD